MLLAHIRLMTPPETLHTARLVLRKPTREDAPLMFARPTDRTMRLRTTSRGAHIRAFPTARSSLAAFLICGATDAGSTGCCSDMAAVSSWVLLVSAEKHTGLSLDMSWRGDIGATDL